MTYHTKLKHLRNGKWEEAFTTWAFLTDEEAFDKAAEYLEWIKKNNYDFKEWRITIINNAKTIIFDSMRDM